MDRKAIIDGLKMTMELCVFDPSTGEEIEPHLLNDMNRATYDACKGALEILGRLDTDTDTISRQAVIELVKNSYYNLAESMEDTWSMVADVEQLPSAQLDIIRCRNCKFASGDSRICMKFGHGPIGELDFCAWAERRTDG